MSDGSACIAIAAVDRISHALGKPGYATEPCAFVVRFAASDPDHIAPAPLVLAASNVEEAGEKALEALRLGYPHLKAGDDPLFFWMNARAALRVMLMLESVRARGGQTAQMRRLRRAQAIDKQLEAFSGAFRGPRLTKRGWTRALRGDLSGLTYEPALSPLEELDFAYTEDGRRAALLVAGAPFQPIDVVGLTLEFSSLLREAHVYEAHMLCAGKRTRVDTDLDSAARDAAQRATSNPTSDVLWVDAKQAALRLGLSTSYLAQLRVRGDGPKFGKHGRAVRYCIHDLNEWAAGRTQASTSDVSNGR